MADKAKKETRLTEQQRRFCREYFGDPSNGTQAAIRAGYSKKTARSQAVRLLLYANVQSELARLRKAAESDAVLSQQEACEILTAIARSNIADYFDAAGQIAVKPEHSKGDPRAVESVKQTFDFDGNPVIQFKLVSKVAAIERLSRLRGWDAPTKVAPTDPSGERPYALPDVSTEELIERAKRYGISLDGK